MAKTRTAREVRIDLLESWKADSSQRYPEELITRFSKLVETFLPDNGDGDVDEEKLKRARKMVGVSTGTTKLQASVPGPLFDLLRVWASSEGRDTSNAALFALEVGIRKLMQDGVLPPAAITAYEERCLKSQAANEVLNLVLTEYPF